MSKSILLTPQLVEALAPLCDVEMVGFHIESLEDMQDFVIAKADDSSAPKCLDHLRFIRNIKVTLEQIHEALLQSKEGGVCP